MKSARFSLVFSIAALLLLSLMTSCRRDSPTGPTDTTTTSCCHGRITLTVLDSTTSAPLDGGMASLYDGDHLVSQKPMIDSGTVWDGLCPGQYHFTISKEHYHGTEFAIDSMGCSDTRTVSHLLVAETTNSGDSCCNGRDYIYVTDSSTHQVLIGATAVLLNRTNGVSQTVVSSSSTNGSIRFGNLCPGSYLCTISKYGYHTVTFDFAQGCNGVLSFSKSLLSTTITHTDSCCNGRDYITVTDSSTGHALSGARLAVYRSGTQIAADTTSYNNAIRLGNLCPGNYRVTIDHDGYNQGVIEFSQSCNGVLSLTKGLLATTNSGGCDSASITVHLQDSVHQDIYLAGATVTVRIYGHTDYLETGTTTVGGYFTATGLISPDTYIFTFSKYGYNEKSIVMQIGDCHKYYETYQLGLH